MSDTAPSYNLEALHQEADRRALEAMTDFDLVRHTVGAMAMIGWNTLDLPNPSVEGGSTVCLNSLIEKSAATPPDRLEINGDMLVRQRQLPELTVAARYVGLWPRAKEAALYDVSASFTPGPMQIVSRSFRPLAEHILREQGTLEAIQETDHATILAPCAFRSVIMAPGLTPEPTGTEIIPLSEAQLTASKVGFPDHTKGTHSWELRIAGPVGLKLPEGSFFRVNERSVQISPDYTEEPLQVHTPESDLVINYDAPLHATVRIEPSGKIIVQRQSGQEDHEMAFRIPTAAAFALAEDDIAWQNHTSQFLQTWESALLEELGRMPQNQIDAAKALRIQPHASIEQALQQRVEPSVVGSMAVLNALRESPRAHALPYAVPLHALAAR